MDKYIKKSFDDLGYEIQMYLHFHGAFAVQQIEVSDNGVMKLDESNPVIGDAFLYDQTYSDIEWDEKDFISKEEFDNVWDRMMI